MQSRVALFLLASLSLAMSTLFVTSFAAIEMDEPVYAPLQDAASASEVPAEQDASKERRDSKRPSRPSSAPAEIRWETDSAPEPEEIEPLSEPMLA